MLNNIHSVLIATFVVTWIVLGAISVGIFYFGRNAARKRRWFAPFVVLVGVLFVGFTTAIFFTSEKKPGQSPPWQILALLVPGTSVITYLNLKFTRFCDGCGATIVPRSFIQRTRFCPHCGASLDDVKNTGESHGAA